MMKDSEENGVREIDKLLVSMGIKPSAEEMLRKGPMNLMRLIMGRRTVNQEDPATTRRGGQGDDAEE